MKTKIVCDSCGKAYQVRPEVLGKKGRCKVCRAKFVMRAEEEEESDDYVLLDLDDAPSQPPVARPPIVAPPTAPSPRRAGEPPPGSMAAKIRSLPPRVRALFVIAAGLFFLALHHILIEIFGPFLNGVFALLFILLFLLLTLGCTTVCMGIAAVIFPKSVMIEGEIDGKLTTKSRFFLVVVGAVAFLWTFYLAFFVYEMV